METDLFSPPFFKKKGFIFIFKLVFNYIFLESETSVLKIGMGGA